MAADARMILRTRSSEPARPATAAFHPHAVERRRISGFGPFRTCRRLQRMSAHRGRPEVINLPSERREWAKADVVWTRRGVRSWCKGGRPPWPASRTRLLRFVGPTGSTSPKKFVLQRRRRIRRSHGQRRGNSATPTMRSEL